MSASIVFLRYSVIFFGMRVNVLHLFECRLLMYIERDSRKTMPRKEQQGGSEYLSKCLDLLIYHIVQELPGILGKFSLLTKQIFPLLTLSRNRYLLIYIQVERVYFPIAWSLDDINFLNFFRYVVIRYLYWNAWFPIWMFCVCGMVSLTSSVRNEAQRYKRAYQCSKDTVKSVNILQSKSKFAP